MTILSFFRINTQFENVGDALINREMLRLAAQHSSLVVDVSRVPRDFIAALDIPVDALKTRSVLQFYFILIRSFLNRETSYFFLCPGGVGGELSIKRFFISILKLLMFFIFNKMGVRICHVGASFDNLGRRHVSYLKLRSNFMHRFYVRDSLSEVGLLEQGIRNDGVLPDFAFNVFTGSNVRCGVVPNRICISFRVDQYPDQIKVVENFIDQIVKLISPSTTILLFAQVDRDVLGMEAIAAYLKRIGHQDIDIHYSTKSIEESRRILSTCSHVLSNRLHVLLLGAAACGNMIACIDATNQKIKGLFQTIGIGDFILDIENTVTKESFDKVFSFRFDGSGLRDDLRKGFASLYL